MEEKPEVVEAIRRLPEQDQFLRLYRLKRALDLSMKHALLPQEQWTKQEEACAYIYTNTHRYTPLNVDVHCYF